MSYSNSGLAPAGGSFAATRYFLWIGGWGSIVAIGPTAETVRPFNPLSRHARTLLEILLSGEHALHGFANCDLTHSSHASRSLSLPTQEAALATFARLLLRRPFMAAAFKLREVAYSSPDAA